MEDTPVTVIGIIIAAIMMFLVPLVTIADRNDDIAQLVVQTETAEFVDKIIKTGKITDEDYQTYLLNLASSGNTYQVDIEIKILDENTSKKTTDQNSKIGKNTYYSIYTSQIEEKLANDKNAHRDIQDYKAKIVLKDGDIISVTAKNSSMTLSQTLKSVYYTIVGDDLYIISSSSAGTIAVNGAT